MKMKTKILISIHPEYVRQIINGAKKYEYRRVVAKENVYSILIYETIPVKKVVAEAEVLEVLAMSPDELWEQTKDYSGISKAFFESYFAGRKIAYAYKLGKVMAFKEHKPLAAYGLRIAPQSFAYVE